MAWIELHQAIWTHRKTFELAAALDLDETYAAAHLIRLWTWCIDNAPDGDLSTVSDRAIAFGSGWRQNAEPYVQALISSGWLDDDRQIHDWAEYGGKLVERRRADAERKRNAAPINKESARISGGRPAEFHRNSHVHNKTVQNSTEQDTTGEIHPPSSDECARPALVALSRESQNDAATRADDPPLRSAALSPDEQERADRFNAHLTGIAGYDPSPEFLAKVVTKYSALDLDECALAIAGYAKKRPKWLSNAAILNWLRRDLDRLNGKPDERRSTNGRIYEPEPRSAASANSKRDLSVFAQFSGLDGSRPRIAAAASTNGGLPGGAVARSS